MAALTFDGGVRAPPPPLLSCFEVSEPELLRRGLLAMLVVLLSLMFSNWSSKWKRLHHRE